MEKPTKEVPVDELIPRRIRDLVRECACSRLTCYTFCGCDCHKHSLTDIEARRRERNFARRARYQAYRSAGMVKTPYGWE